MAYLYVKFVKTALTPF